MNGYFSIQSLTRRIVVFFCALCLFVGSAIAPATALPTANNQLIADNAAEALDRKAKSGLDSVAGSGTSDKLEGKVQETVGTAKQKIGDIDENVEGGMQRVKGNLQQAAGEAKGNMYETPTDYPEATGSGQEGPMNAIRNLFD